MRYLAATGAAVTCAAALVLLYAGLYDLAIRGGTSPDVAWLFPLMVDGPVAVGYGCAYVLRDKKGRYYAWAVVAGFAAVSAWAQYRHATGVGGDPWVAVIPSVSAPVALHLVALLARFERIRPLRAKTRPEPQPAAVTPPPLHALPTPPRTRKWEQDAAVRDLVLAAAKAGNVTAAAITRIREAAGVSERTAYRYVEQAKTEAVA